MVADGVGGELATRLKEWEVAGEGPANSEFGGRWVGVDALERH